MNAAAFAFGRRRARMETYSSTSDSESKFSSSSSRVVSPPSSPRRAASGRTHDAHSSLARARSSASSNADSSVGIESSMEAPTVATRRLSRARVMATPAKPCDELALDDAASRNFVRFYRALVDEKDGSRGEGDATTTTTTRIVRFFDRKEFMSAHGDDAVYIARTFYKVRDTSTPRRARAVRGRDAREARERDARRVDVFKLLRRAVANRRRARESEIGVETTVYASESGRDD